MTIAKKELKYYSSLLSRKERRTEKKFIAEGRKLVAEGLGSKFFCEIVFTTQDFFERELDFVSYIKNSGVKMEILRKQAFLKLTDAKTPQEIVGIFSIPEAVSFSYREKIIVYLDNVSDPGNVGAIIRACDWFGIENIFLSENCADAFNPKTLRSTMGSIFRVNIFDNVTVDNFFEELKNKSYKIFIADLEGKNYRELEKFDKACFIFSSEAHGPSKELATVRGQKITIPRIGQAESLNVAQAAAIILSRAVQ